MTTAKTVLIPVFPGTNCEKETRDWVADNLPLRVEYLSLEKHDSLRCEEIAAVVIPGGFSFGDYLRAGALAARSDSMKFVKFLSEQNVPVLGICNGFQILCEAQMLPGALVKNVTHQHHHFTVALEFGDEIAKSRTPWLPRNSKLHSMSLPMSCGMGCYLPPHFANSEDRGEFQSQIVLTYKNNENGSTASIAALTNRSGNVLGMMPHPERASELTLGSDEGLIFLQGLCEHLELSARENSPLENFIREGKR